jgi:hypothetical protein
MMFDAAWSKAVVARMGFRGAVALDGGMKAWREAGFPLKIGEES